MNRRLANLALAAALVVGPALGLGAHRSEELLAPGGWDTAAVSLNGHPAPDSSVHVEALAGFDSLHCASCLVQRQNPTSLETRRAAPVSLAVATALAPPRDPGSTPSPFERPDAPRAPPST